MQGGGGKLNSGLHYLKPYIYAKDSAGNELPAIEYGVLAWYPEYNVPHVSFNAIEDGVIKVTQGASIIVSIFDDDDLKSYKWAIVKREDFETAENAINLDAATAEKGGTVSEILKDGIRTTTFIVETKDGEKDSNDKPLALGRYKLVIEVIDESNADRNRADGRYFEVTDVRLTNQDAPSIFVSSPEENSVPSLDGDNFTLTGKVVDNEDNVKILISWLGPDAGKTQIENAENLFDSDSYDFEPEGDAFVSPLGGKVWKISPSSTEGSAPSITYNFTKEFDFFADYFKVNGKVDNTPKVFMIAAKDPTGNVTTKTFRLNSFPEKISFRTEYKENGGGTYTTEENPLIILTPGKTYNFKITPETGGMPIVTSSVSGTGITASETSTGSNVWTFNVTGSSGEKLEVSLSAKDKLDYSLTEKRTILFDEVGKLESITCNANSGNTFRKGEIIKLQANFDKKISLYGLSTNNEKENPYITLSSTVANSIQKKQANGTIAKSSGELAKVYYTASATNIEANTLYFEYTVPENIETGNLTISGITLPSNVSCYGDVVGKDGWNKVDDKNYTIDSIAPYIISMTPTNGGVQAATMNATGDEAQDVTITLKFNEPVYTESGTITMQRTDTYWYIPPVLTNEVFMKIFNQSTDAQKVTLVGADGATQTYTYGKDENDIDTLIAAGPYMQYTQGLDMSGTNAVPDLDTKYVLAYKYGIGETSGAVQALREVLEARNYHKKEFDVTSVGGSGTDTITLKVSKDDFIGGLINGVEYFLTITANSFRDENYNNYVGSNKKEDGITYALAKDEYKFWVGPVATPVIRVNRTATNKYDTKPSGKTSIKIDCVTPGATVKYATTVQTATAPHTNGTYTESLKATVGTMDNYGELTTASAISKSTLTGLSASTAVTMSNGTGTVTDAVGDGSLKTAEKIGIKATASKTGMTDASGYEGAFKTVLHSVQPGKYRMGWNGSGNVPQEQWNYYTGTEFRIYGAQVPEASAYTSGWPLTQNGNTYRSDWQVAWKDVDGTVDNEAKESYYWVSWQILTPFTLQTMANSFQEHANPSCTYGQYIYYYQMQYWGSN